MSYRNKPAFEAFLAIPENFIFRQQDPEIPENEKQLPVDFVDDMNRTYNVGGEQISPLQFCIEENKLNVLFKKILTVQKDFSGALQWALRAGNIERFQDVLKAMQDQAIALYSQPVVEEDFQNEVKQEAPEVFDYSQFPIPACINARDEYNYTPVDLAIHLGELDALRKLITAGANLNLPANNLLPIQRAIFAIPGKGPQQEARIAILAMLLEKESKVNLDQTYGQNSATLLTLATSEFKTASLRTLLSNEDIKKTINNSDNMGTALSHQCMHIKGSKAPMAILGAILLLNAGATINDNSRKILVKNRDGLIEGLIRLEKNEKYEDVRDFLRTIEANSDLHNIIYPLKKEDELTRFVLHITNEASDQNLFTEKEIKFANFVKEHRDLKPAIRVSRALFSGMKKSLKKGEVSTIDHAENYALANNKLGSRTNRILFPNVTSTLMFEDDETDLSPYDDTLEHKQSF